MVTGISFLSNVACDASLELLRDMTLPETIHMVNPRIKVIVMCHTVLFEASARRF